MICPRCAVPTEAIEHHGVRIPSCSRCGGLYLHHGELNKIAAPTQGDLEFSTLHGESFQHEDRFPPIQCPDCGKATMKKVEFNIHTGIVLDYCPLCRGFWLDGTELQRIDEEVRELDQASGPGPDTGMLWFARFIWSLPR
jgi:Zn-finger nucleic acid-binding protein